jgi:RNA recognition motif-containing protein
MLNDKEAKEAIDNLNGAEIKGRAVNVNQAREKENNAGGGERRSFRSRS